jgi:hypothetical protein
MYPENPFELTRLERVEKSDLQNVSMLRCLYHHPDGWTASGDGTMIEHCGMQLSPITWNSRLGIYESQERIHQSSPVLGSITQSILIFAAIWSLCELPLELLVSPTTLEVAALIIGKMIWMFLTLWALTGGQAAKTIFAFCCGASALAIASGLLNERQFFALGFCLSAVECASKAAAFFLIVVRRAR